MDFSKKTNGNDDKRHDAYRGNWMPFQPQQPYRYGPPMQNWPQYSPYGTPRWLFGTPPVNESAAKTSVVAKKIDNRSQFSLYVRNDSIEPCESKEGIVDSMKQKIGQFMKPQAGPRQTKRWGFVQYYHCDVANCPRKCRVRLDSATNQYYVEDCMGAAGPGFQCNKHYNHAEIQDDKLATFHESHGLQYELRSFVDARFALDTSVTVETLMKSIRTEFYSSTHSSIQMRLTDGDAYRKTQNQVRNRLEYLNLQRLGHGLNTVYDYMALLEQNKFKIPAGYSPRNNYQTPIELANALGLPHPHSLMYIFLQDTEFSGILLDTLVAGSAAWKKAKEDLTLAFIAVTPASLFCLLKLSKRPNGHKALYTDGTRGVSSTRHALIPIGTMDVRYRATQNRVTQSFRPCLYLISREEATAPFELALLLSNWLSKSLFDSHFSFDYVESDKTLAFIGPCVKHGGKPLNCYFHVVQQLNNGKPLYGKFRNKKYIDVARTHIHLLHNCQTREQFSLVMAAVCEQWKNANESKAADHLLKEYGTHPYSNWFFQVSTVPGITPQGSSNEAFNNGVKGNKTRKELVRLNVSMERFIGDSLPAIAKEQAETLFLEVDLQVPKTTERYATFAARLMTVNKDYRQLSAGVWICNTFAYIGMPVTEDRIALYHAAREGKAECFQSGKKDDPIARGYRSVRATRSLCLVRRSKDHGNHWIGNCQLCMKRLGWGCPGLVAVRNIQDDLPMRLNEAVAFVPKTNKGSPIAAGLTGPAFPKYKRSNKKHVAVPMDDLAYYYNNGGLKAKDRQKLAEHLRILGNSVFNANIHC